MHSAVLVSALVLPLVAAVVALLVPSGATGSSGPGRRRDRKSKKGDEAVGGEVADAAPAAAPSDSPASMDPLLAERAGMTRRALVRFAALTSASLWLALALLGAAAAGPARAVGAVAPAAAGIALLLAATGGPLRRLPAAASSLALALASGSLTLGVGRDGAGWVVAGLTASCVLVAVVGRSGREEPLGPSALALGGTAAVVGGLARVVGTTGALELPADGRLAIDAGLLLVGGSAAVAVAAALRPRSAIGLLLPLALALGVPSATTLGAAGDAVGLALMLLALAATAGWAATTAQFPDARLLAAALALAALAAASIPTMGIPGTGSAVDGVRAAGVPAAWLLAAAAVITAVCLVPLAALSAVPGMAALVVVLVADPAPARLALAALLVAAVVATAAAVSRPSGRSDEGEIERFGVATGTSPLFGPLLAAVPALGLGLWLLVAPTSWTWVGQVRLVGWSDSVALAVAGGLIAVVAAGAAGRVAVPRPPVVVAPDPVLGADAGPGGRLVLVAGVALGLALLSLVASL